jgi:hypothetical protein
MPPLNAAHNPTKLPKLRVATCFARKVACWSQESRMLVSCESHLRRMLVSRASHLRRICVSLESHPRRMLVSREPHPGRIQLAVEEHMRRTWAATERWTECSRRYGARRGRDAVPYAEVEHGRRDVGQGFWRSYRSSRRRRGIRLRSGDAIKADIFTTVRAELVEALHFSINRRRESPSTSSGRTVGEAAPASVKCPLPTPLRTSLFCRHAGLDPASISSTVENSGGD